VEVTGTRDLLPTIIEEGEDDRGVERERIPASEAMCEEAPESKYQSPPEGGVTIMVLKAEARER